MTGWIDYAGSLVDMFTGTPQGASATGARAAGSAIANSGAGQEAKHVAGNTDFGKATGLSPWMKMLGMGGPEAPPQDRMATPSEMRDLKAGKAPATPGGSLSDIRNGRGFYGSGEGGGVTGQRETKGFEKKTNADGTSGGYQLPSTQQWSAVGRSGGNRKSDIEARDKPVKVGAPSVWQPNLSKIPRTVTGQRDRGDKKATSGAGAFHESAYGSHTDKEGSWGSMTFNPADGTGGTSIYSRGYQAGVEEKGGYRALAISDDKRHSAQAEAGYVANAGLSGSYGLDTKNGAYATGGVGAKAGLYAQADADTKTDSVKIGGQDYDAGIGVHGDAFVGAKAGASGTVGLGPDFVGAKGNIGAFVGAEAAGDVHANLGPVGGKLGGSVMAGAGIGADGDISYKDGKFHIGGKMFAALGYGGSVSADMTVDVGKIAKTAGSLASDAYDYVADSPVGQAASDAYDYVADSPVGDALSSAGEGISDAAGAVSDTVGGAYNAVSDWWNSD